MKKNIYVSLTFLSLFAFTNCKDDVKIEPVAASEIDTLKTILQDTNAVQSSKISEKNSLDKPYNELEDAQLQINELLSLAKSEGKNIFIQAGGNWCIWCLRFNDFVQNNSETKNIIDANFKYYHLNYSNKNKNEEIFAKYAPNGKELGFPFFIVLNPDGKVLNVIASANLEADKSYDLTKVKQMFIDNSPK